MKTTKICTLCKEEKHRTQFAGYLQDLNRCTKCHQRIMKDAQLAKSKTINAQIESRLAGEMPKAKKRPVHNGGCWREIERIKEDSRLEAECADLG